jgi:1-acyl-sn-glycerol-3-phosphate acyltransferase
MPNPELNRVRVPNPSVYDAAGALAKLYFPIRGGISTGWEEELFETEQARIFAINHKSILDPPAVGYELKKVGVEIYTLGKIELSKNKHLDRLLGCLGNIPFDRDKDLFAQPAGQAVSELLDGGGNLVIFPEEHRYKDEALGPMQKIGALAVRKNAIVYPGAIAGTNRKFGPVRLEFGQPYNVQPESTDDRRPRKEVLREIDLTLPGRIQELYDRAKSNLIA